MEYLEEARKLGDSLDRFNALHGAQLRSLGIPQILHPVLWAKFEAQQLGTSAYDPFEWQKSPHPTDPSRTVLNVVAKKDLIPQQALIVYPHDWTFGTKEQAREHLEASPALRTIVATQLRQAEMLARGFVTEEEAKDAGTAEMSVDEILGKLYRVAFQFQVHTPPSPPATFNYVSADPFGPHAIPFAGATSAGGGKPVLESRVFVRTVLPSAPDAPPRTEVYTILFHNVNPMSLNELGDSEIIKKGTKITRSEMTVMPDYAAPEYWGFHYEQSVERQFEWFVPWKAIGPNIRDLLPTTNGVVLNVGCGTSHVGDGILADRLAAHVLSIDIALPALIALRNTRKPPANGVEDLLQLDLTAPTLPLRPQPLADWAFDKGTLDGLVASDPGDNGVQLVRAVWDHVARLTRPDAVFVVVSLGRPEGRLVLIEDAIGGWEVDACMEVEIPEAVARGDGASARAAAAFGLTGIRRCYIYVCKKKPSTEKAQGR
ncbi:hypothetical protein HDU96_005319 [Phlyctochytrium bullatum]|nr:hypothetical protein HDU96_005319 [Phlyctochytrium bullatum]